MTTKSTEKSQGLARLSQRARRTAGDPNRLAKLLEDSKDKMGKLKVNDEKVKGFMAMLGTFIRMIRAYLRGEYRIIPWKTLLLIVAGLIYFVSPLDLIPDFIPITGFLDDISIVIWIFNRLQNDIRDFELWEQDPNYQTTH